MKIFENSKVWTFLVHKLAPHGGQGETDKRQSTPAGLTSKGIQGACLPQKQDKRVSVLSNQNLNSFYRGSVLYTGQSSQQLKCSPGGTLKMVPALRTGGGLGSITQIQLLGQPLVTSSPKLNDIFLHHYCIGTKVCFLFNFFID